MKVVAQFQNPFAQKAGKVVKSAPKKAAAPVKAATKKISKKVSSAAAETKGWLGGEGGALGLDRWYGM
jgi:hypothetical protein